MLRSKSVAAYFQMSAVVPRFKVSVNAAVNTHDGDCAKETIALLLN